MSSTLIRDRISEMADLNECSVSIIEDMDDCIIGTLDTEDGLIRVVYSEQSIIQKHKTTNDWSHEEALDYFYFNIKDGIPGPNSPVIVDESVTIF